MNIEGHIMTNFKPQDLPVSIRLLKLETAVEDMQRELQGFRKSYLSALDKLESLMGEVIGTQAKKRKKNEAK